MSEPLAGIRMPPFFENWAIKIYKFGRILTKLQRYSSAVHSEIFKNNRNKPKLKANSIRRESSQKTMNRQPAKKGTFESKSLFGGISAPNSFLIIKPHSNACAESKTNVSASNHKRNTVLLSPSKRLDRFFNVKTKTQISLPSRDGEFSKILNEEHKPQRDSLVLRLTNNSKAEDNLQKRQLLRRSESAKQSRIVSRERFRNLIQSSDLQNTVNDPFQNCPYNSRVKQVKRNKTVSQRKVSESSQSCETPPLQKSESKFEKLKRQVDTLRKTYSSMHLRKSESTYRKSTLCSSPTRREQVRKTATNPYSSQLKKKGKVIEERFGRKLILRKDLKRKFDMDSESTAFHSSGMNLQAKFENQKQKPGQSSESKFYKVNNQVKMGALVNQSEKIKGQLELNRDMSDPNVLHFTFGTMALMDYKQFQNQQCAK